MKKVYYFAYGSNLLHTRLLQRVGNCPKIGTHVLKDYKLDFNCKGFANITPEKGAFVEGVLYELNGEQFKKLSWYEGLYHTEFFEVKGELVCVYIADHAETLQARFYKPQLNYINIILDGCLENNLVDTYNNILKFKQENYKLKGSRHKFL